MLFTGYPWNPIGVIWVPTGWRMLAPWVGTYALSGMAVLLAGALMIDAARRAWPPLACLAVAIALVALPFGEATPPDRGGPLVRVVQPNIGQEGVADRFYPERVLRTLIALSGRPGPRPRLVVWPEGMVMQWLEDGYPRQLYFDGEAVFSARASPPRWGRATWRWSAARRCSSAPDRRQVAGRGQFGVGARLRRAAARALRQGASRPPSANICRCARSLSRSASPAW